MGIIDEFGDDAQPQDLIPAQATDLTCNLEEAMQLIALGICALLVSAPWQRLVQMLQLKLLLASVSMAGARKSHRAQGSRNALPCENWQLTPAFSSPILGLKGALHTVLQFLTPGQVRASPGAFRFTSIEERKRGSALTLRCIQCPYK